MSERASERAKRYRSFFLRVTRSKRSPKPLIGQTNQPTSMRSKSSAQGNANKSYKKRRMSLKILMYFFMVINLYFFAIGRATMIGALGMVILMVITPSLHIGGSSLVKLLTQFGDPPKNKRAEVGMDLKTLIKRTSLHVFVMTPIFLVSAALMLFDREKIQKSGERTVFGTLYGSVLMTIWSSTMTYSAHQLLTFFDETNKRKLEKLRKSKLGGAKQFVKGLSSIFRSTKGKSGRTSKSRKTTTGVNGTSAGSSTGSSTTNSNVSSGSSMNSSLNGSSSSMGGSSSKSSGGFFSSIMGSSKSSSIQPEDESTASEYSDFEEGSVASSVALGESFADMGESTAADDE